MTGLNDRSSSEMSWEIVARVYGNINMYIVELSNKRHGAKSQSWELTSSRITQFATFHKTCSSTIALTTARQLFLCRCLAELAVKV
jgi:hypothetical protein